MEEPIGQVKAPEPAPDQMRDERMWAMLCHLTTFSGFIIPMGNVIAPLIVWMIKKDEYPLVNDQGKESLNFQISILIYLLVAIILIIVLIGIPLLIAILIFDIVAVIIASIRANEGEKYRYPFAIRLIS